MTISSVSSSALAQTQISSQNTGSDIEKSDNKRANTSADKNLGGNQFEDNVTLSQAGSANDSSRVIGENDVESQLPRIQQSILSNSTQALSVQANVNNQTALDMLVKN